MSKCTECANYGLMKMVTSGQPFQYYGDIPCQRCSELTKEHIEFTPKTSQEKEVCWSLPAVSPVVAIQKALSELGY